MKKGIRHCPHCDCEITHKNQYIANFHAKKGTLCKSCGYINKRSTILPKIGEKFYEWTVIDSTLRTSEVGKPKTIRVQCKCGTEVNIIPLYVIDGRSKQCRNCSSDKLSKTSYTGYDELSGTYFGILQKNAISRGLQFNVSIEYLYSLFVEQNKKCALTGLDITLNKYYIRDIRTKSLYQTASVDRINSSLGYIEGNVQWVHRDINFMKGSLSQESFVYLCQLVTNKK